MTPAARPLGKRLQAAAAIGASADWLGRHHPIAYRTIRPASRLVMRTLGRPSYWDARRNYHYYEEVVRLARMHVPAGGCVVDVGANETALVDRLGWFEERVALDVRNVMPRRGIKTVVADFGDWEPGKRFDLVLCLQVLEHLSQPGPFARKLLRTGQTVIVSVPYRWAANACPSHLHDPVDETKLRLWTDAEPIETSIVEDNRERLVAVYTPSTSSLLG